MKPRNDNYLVPDSIETARNDETGSAKITFSSDDGASTTVVLPQPQLLLLASRLPELLERSNLTAISLSDLHVDQTVETLSFRCQPNADGSLKLTFGLRVDGRVVTMPLNLDRDSAQELARAIDSA